MKVVFYPAMIYRQQVIKVLTTKYRIKDKYFWFGCPNVSSVMFKPVPYATKIKRPNRHPRVPLTPYQAGSPMEHVHLDFLGPLPKSSRVNEYILVMVDQFTKWIECVPLPSQIAEVTAHAAVCDSFARFGYPFYIHTDQGRTSQLFTAICDICGLLGIHKTWTTAYRPLENGQVERFNRTLMDAV